MKSKFLIFLFIFASSIINAQVPEKPEDISPLLIGEKVPKATLLDNKGEEVSLRDLLKERPTVLVFYRGGWCPYCNRHLASLASTELEIINMGYQIVAISPDNYKNLMPTIENNDVKYQLLSDPGAQLIQEVGIGFKTPGMAKIFITKKTKMDATDILPVPTVMVLNTSGDILFEYINPDYKTRLSEDLLLVVLKSIKSEL